MQAVQASIWTAMAMIKEGARRYFHRMCSTTGQSLPDPIRRQIPRNMLKGRRVASTRSTRVDCLTGGHIRSDNFALISSKSSLSSSSSSDSTRKIRIRGQNGSAG
uniref:(northern house mosquito) hypothetical protein n=1 Tax=Culex pipiens TaxID=7175 RepID=A0A8D8GFC6_CULPI